MDAFEARTEQRVSSPVPSAPERGADPTRAKRYLLLLRGKIMSSAFANQYWQYFDAKISASGLNRNRQDMVAVHERFAQGLARKADELQLASVDAMDFDVTAHAYKLNEDMVRRRANEILASKSRNSSYNSSSALDEDGLLRGLTPAQHAEMLLAVEMAATSVSAVETMDILGMRFQRLEDFTAALYWYSRAAKEGHLPSILNLSDLLFALGKTHEAAT